MSEIKTEKEFKPYIAAGSKVAEFTLKSILLGAVFGVIFGAATVYLALKAGLTVSASIPIAVLAISIGRKFFKTTILENNIIQTTGSAGESIAAGVVFTLPGFLFLSAGSNSESFFSYWPIFFLAALGGILGTLMMIPLRKSLIVDEHGNLPYPEGTACASVLIAGEKGGDFAKTAYYGLAFAFAYAILQKVFHVIAEAPAWATTQTNKYFPSVELCGVKSLSFAVGAYLPLSTTLPIFAGGAIKGLVDRRSQKKHEKTENDELGRGNLFATGLVAGGALMGVIYAFLKAFETTAVPVDQLNMEESLTGLLGTDGYQVMGFIFFVIMGLALYKIALGKSK